MLNQSTESFIGRNPINAQEENQGYHIVTYEWMDKSMVTCMVVIGKEQISFLWIVGKQIWIQNMNIGVVLDFLLKSSSKNYFIQEFMMP